ncbi:uncharacterized protein VP01_1805g5 [Puccinia sorghi]|uniref:Uncharacterized protein n=1 Tax=Puccinia sorghi TaxID=27349 RepID=A0A0L6VEB4_9BASI|nr:uncharacterized protein VP01_1805g5 [Puccinia sorghi]
MPHHNQQQQSRLAQGLQHTFPDTLFSSYITNSLNFFFSSMEKDPQSNNIQQLEFLGKISGNCIITWALLQKGHQTIDVFTWPGMEAGHVLEPLSSILNRLLVGPTSTNTSNTVLIIDTTLVASPTL